MMPKRTFRIVLGLVAICLISLTFLMIFNRRGAPVSVRILAVNDFHGQLQPLANRHQAGGAARLVAALKSAEKGMEDRTVIALAGDTVGASPADSALLHDEPAIMVFNALANPACADKRDPRCNMVSTLGNHEFDKGVPELLRQLHGGNAPDGPFLEKPWKGAGFPYVCANVVDTATKKPLVPPYVIKKIAGVPVAFIGAVVKTTPRSTMPGNVSGLTFLDEADAINHVVPEVQAKGVHAIVAVIHQGGNQEEYAGQTDPDKPTVAGSIVSIVHRLDPDVDIVISGHTHRFTNAVVKNAGGKDVLVTQAFAKSSAYGVIDLVLDPAADDIVRKSAAIMPVEATLTPDPGVADLVARADAAVAPKVSAVVGQATAAITREQNQAGESALGDLIADAERQAGGTDFAFMNPGGIRTDLVQGPITVGTLFAVQPFGNHLVTMELTGAQLYALLAQQWGSVVHPRMLQISGLTYVWTSHGPNEVGSVDAITMADGKPVDKAARYSVTVNAFLAVGGDGFTVFTEGTNKSQRPETEVDALSRFIAARQSVAPSRLDRITRRAAR